MENQMFLRISSDKTFTIKNDHWYNLSTDRYLTKLNEEMWSLKDFKIVGTYDNIVCFCEKNKLILNKITKYDGNFKSLFYQPFNNIQNLFEYVENKCSTNIAGSTIPFVETSNIDDLTEEQMNSLYPFSLTSLILPVVINDVIDGDTLHLSFFLPFVELGVNRKYGQHIVTSALLSSTLSKEGMFIKLKCRMYGYDAKEKNTSEGILAKKYFEEKINLSKKKFWAKFLDQEKYGRTLVILYPRIPGKKFEDNNSLNEYMSNLHSIGLTNNYLGGSKK